MFKNFGKILKSESKYDKAILAFEESYYLACVLELLPAKIEIIAAMTSCYLKSDNIPKVIIYYHKLLDMETDLKKLSIETLNEHMNLNLRLAIRQNLFTANLRLGKLKTCCDCLKEQIEIIDENSVFITNMSVYNDLLKTRFTAAVELSKLYIVEKCFFDMDKLLKSNLKLIEDLEKKKDVDKENLTFFQIKLIAYMSFCAAGLCQMRLSKLYTKKALCKTEKEIKMLGNCGDVIKKDSYMKQYLNLHIECLLLASDTCAKRIQVYREMNNYEEHRNNDALDDIKFEENNVSVDLELRVGYAREAFLKSRSVIDPNLRIQTTHTLAISLYDSQLYESAAYYFNDVLSISKTLLKQNNGSNLQPDNEEFNMNDAMPDYHLEATTYWISCQIFLNFMHADLNQSEKRDELESLLTRAIKAYSRLESCIKLQKLNRLKSLNYSIDSNGNSDRNLSERWNNLFELCVDCLIFLCYRLEKYDDCVFFYENSQFLTNMDADYISHHFQYFYSPTKPPTASFSVITDQTTTDTTEANKAFQQERAGEIKTNFNTFNDLLVVVNESKIPVLIFRFAFHFKFLYSFIMEPENGVVFHNELKLKEIDITRVIHNVKDKDVAVKLSPLYSNEFNYLVHKFDQYKNNFIKNNINKIENRNIASRQQPLINMRNSNYKRDKRFRESINSITKRNESKRVETIQEEHPLQSGYSKQQSIPSNNNVTTHLHRVHDDPITATNTLNDNDFYFEISDIDIDHFKIDYGHLVSEVESRDIPHDKSVFTNSIRGETKQTILKLLKIIFLKPIQSKLNMYHDEQKVVNICTNQQNAKLFVYVLNSTYFYKSEIKIPSYVITIESVFLLSNAALISNKRQIEDQSNLELMRESVINGPDRVKSISINPLVLKIEKENIKPSLTSNPRLAVKQLNENPEDPYIEVDNSGYIRLMKRYDESISTLISETATKTNVKRSNLEILNFYQLNDETYKTYAIGCPTLPAKYEKLFKFKNKKFLANGLDELSQVSKIMMCDPVLNEHATKLEFLNQLTSSTIIHITTFSSNDSDSELILSVSNSMQPHFNEETDKFCVVTCEDFNNVYLDKCKLVVLSCYSLKYHQPRFDLAKKILKRGCRALLIILTPLPNNILQEFFALFYNNIKKCEFLAVAYLNAITNVIKNLNLNEDDYDLIVSSLCLISSCNIDISLDDIGRNMLQLRIDDTLDKYKFTTSKRNLLNYEAKQNFMSVFTDLEKVLIQLQLEFKSLLCEVINIILRKSVTDYMMFKDACNYITILISNSIEYSKQHKTAPEPLLDVIKKNKSAINILTCLGFNFQASSVEPSSLNSDEEKSNDVSNYNKAFITYPNSRFLDLNLRMSHVVTSINDLCFNDISVVSSNSSTPLSELTATLTTTSTDSILEQFDIKYTRAISNFHALLPIEDKKLLSCIIDILALTKFSPEILLSLTDFSVDYVINYYKKKNVEIRDNLTRLSARSAYTSTIDHNYFSTNQNERRSNMYSKNQEINKYKKIDISNKIVNFLFSIGYEIIGLWLRFQDIGTNRQLLDHMLKILTSFSTDRDMSLYRELNVSVLGQRSANTKLFPTDAKMYSLNPVILPNSNVRIILRGKGLILRISLLYIFFLHLKISMITGWGNTVETQEEMRKKVRFRDKFTRLSKRRSHQRIDVLKHHLDYAAEQRKLNDSRGNILRSDSARSTNSVDFKNDVEKKKIVEKIKYHPGGSPIKDRKIVDEKIPLTLEQLDQIREYSHYLCRKRLDKIDIEHNERIEKLVLPYISNNFK